MEEVFNYLICPISGKIFYEPVLADDGEVYEFQEFLKLTKNKKPSPISNKILKDFSFVKNIKSFIDNIQDKYPEIKKLRYENSEDTNLSKDHILNKNIIQKILENGEYDKLLNYSNFMLQYFNINQLKNLLKYASKDVSKYVIDNCQNIDVPIYNESWTLLNYVCNKKIGWVIDYLIEKGANIENVCDGDGWRPIHQIIQIMNSSEYTKKFIDIGADIITPNNNDESPLGIYLPIFR